MVNKTWERDLACSDTNSILKLAEVLGVSVENLLNAKKQNNIASKKTYEIINIALIGVGIAMGICVVVTSILNKLDMKSAFILLGIGLFSIGVYLLKNKDNW